MTCDGLPDESDGLYACCHLLALLLVSPFVLFSFLLLNNTPMAHYPAVDQSGRRRWGVDRSSRVFLAHEGYEDEIVDTETTSLPRLFPFSLDDWLGSLGTLTGRAIARVARLVVHRHASK